MTLFRFHTVCINTWLTKEKSGNLCPLCRNYVVRDDEYPQLGQCMKLHPSYLCQMVSKKQVLTCGVKSIIRTVQGVCLDRQQFNFKNTCFRSHVRNMVRVNMYCTGYPVRDGDNCIHTALFPKFIHGYVYFSLKGYNFFSSRSPLFMPARLYK